MRTSSSSIARPPPIPGPFPGPPPRNKLRSPRSISTLPDGRQVYGRPSSIVAASQSSLALNMRDSRPPQFGPGQPSVASASTTSIPGLLSGHTPLPSSLLNVRQPPPRKVEKRGFFSKLFGFGKSKRKEPPAQMPTERLYRPTPSARPVSVISFNSTTSSTTLRQRAVLMKKPPSTYPAKSNRPSAVLTRSGRPSQHQNNDPQPTYPRIESPFLSSIPEDMTTTNVMNHATPAKKINYATVNHMTTTTNPGPSFDSTRSSTHQPFGTYHTPGMATTSHTKQAEKGAYYEQYPNHTNGRHSGTEDSGYHSQATTPDPTLCTVCNTNRQYIEPKTGKVSPYCSDACQAAVTVAPPQPQQPACSYPGCTQPAVMYPADHYWNYCSEAHERYARKGCISCRDADDSGGQLCKRCKETFKQRAPIIVPVPMDHDAFWHVVDKFSQSWADPTRCPIFQAARVYKVVLTEERRDLYLGYRDTLEHYGRFTMKGKISGNERVLWHGARRSCHMGERGQTTPCTISRCSLCSVLRGSSDIGKATMDMPAGRFGPGIYTFTKASKASDNSSNDKNVDTPWVPLLLSKVAAGHECVMRHDNTGLTAPPQGYDSVIGEVRGRLNYDELVVYTTDAIRPTWLVMYQRT